MKIAITHFLSHYRGPYRGGPQDDQGGDGIEGGPRGGVGPGGRGPPRRFFRRNFRGGRGGGGGPRRARSQDSQGGQGGMASGGEEGGQGQLQQRGGPQRPRYRRRGPVRPRSTSGGGNGNGGGPQEQQQGQQSPPPQQQQLQQQQQQSEPAWDIVAKVGVGLTVKVDKLLFMFDDDRARLSSNLTFNLFFFWDVG